MDKITFLNELETELDDLPRKEKDKVMNEYEDIFYNQETKGKTDAQILDDLKNPYTCLLYTSPSPRDRQKSRMPSSA